MQQLLEMVDINKSFGNNHALKSVCLKVMRNEIVGLVGENGAGKSTLMKVLTGIYKADSGKILIDGKLTTITNLHEASKYGISMIFQEQSVLKNIAVYENLFIAHESNFKKYGLLSKKKMIEEAKKILENVGLNISPNCNTYDLSFSQCQMIEIARNIWLAEKSAIENPLIILDEPTTALEKAEIKLLFDRLKELKKVVSIVYISHNLSEIVELCDRAYVLKDGENTACFLREEITEEIIREKMVGKGAFADGEYYLTAMQSKPSEEIVVELTNTWKNHEFEDVSLKIHKGEIIALCGTVGSGKEALCECLCGIRQFDSGTVSINGSNAAIRSPYEAFKHSIGYTPEDRRGEGLILDLPIYENMTLPILKNLKKFKFFINKKEQYSKCSEMIKNLDIRLNSMFTHCSSLSGGNQQKVIIAKWVLSRVRVLVMSHPTRGVDVKAKQQIYKVMREIASNGISILLMGDSFEEDIGLANRIITMKNRRITGELDATNHKPSPSEILDYIV